MNTEIQMRAKLNSNPYYNKTVKFMTNQELDTFIAQFENDWKNKYTGCLGLAYKCLKVVELMGGK